MQRQWVSRQYQAMYQASDSWVSRGKKRNKSVFLAPCPKTCHRGPSRLYDMPPTSPPHLAPTDVSHTHHHKTYRVRYKCIPILNLQPIAVVRLQPIPRDLLGGAPYLLEPTRKERQIKLFFRRVLSGFLQSLDRLWVGCDCYDVRFCGRVRLGITSLCFFGAPSVVG
jgi:hypothetical protein